MGPLLVLVSPCFRENVNVTCKIVSFSCSSDNFLLKNVIVFSIFLEIKFQNGTHWKKRLFLTYFLHFFYTHTHILLTLLTFLPNQFCKNYKFIMYAFSLVWLLVLTLIRTILEQSINNKMVNKIKVGMSTTDFVLLQNL